MKISFEPHSKMWNMFFKKECVNLQKILKTNIVEVHHIGSTSIPSIVAVPILDILCVVHTLDGIAAFRSLIESSGYTFTGNADSEILFTRTSSDKSTTLSKITILDKSDERVGQFLDFRDYLNSEDSVATEFNKLKLNHVNDSASYEKAKNAFIAIVLSSL